MIENYSEVLSKLSDPGNYSVLCSFLYDLHKEPKYSTLSELCYLLDVNSLINLFEHYAGQVVKIPTKEEFKEAIQLLRLFQYYEVEKRPWKDAVKLSGLNTKYGKKIHDKLDILKDTLDHYNFENRNY